MLTLALAVVLALGVGVVLGALGGGGSVLALPILLHVVGKGEREAIAGSLVVVGATAAVAGLRHARAGNVDWRVALPFAFGAMGAAWAAGRLSHHVPAPLLIGLFAVLMLVTATGMWRGRKEATAQRAPIGVVGIVAFGAAVGAVAGLVGAGGGFLVVPVFTLFAGLPVARAVGSSLVVIALQSLAGAFGHAAHVDLDFTIAAVAAAAVAGSFAGVAVSKRLPAVFVRRAFAVLIVVVAVALLGAEARALLSG